MCGIVGILGKTPVAPQIVDALKRLEYRGYDSAGVATLEDGGRLERRRAEGKLVNLEVKLLEGAAGRRDRHRPHPLGDPWRAERGATPTRTRPRSVAVVHNGIIENFRELQGRAAAPRACASRPRPTPRSWRSSSRSEMRRGQEPDGGGRRDALPRLRGAFALAFLFAGDEDLLIGARHGPPLAVGHGEGEMYLGSDAIALAPFTDEITYLEDGDWAVLSRARASRSSISTAGRSSGRASAFRPATFMVDKGNHRHFMAKEIYEQPEVVGHTLAHYVDFTAGKVVLPDPLPFDFKALKRMSISACGTAYLRRADRQILVRAPCAPAGRDRCRLRVPLPRAAAGEGAAGAVHLAVRRDRRHARLAALRQGAGAAHRRRRQRARPRPWRARAPSSLPTLAGPEIGVASTKAFTCQLTVLLCLAIAAGRARGTLSETEEAELVDALIAVPRLMADALKLEHQIEMLEPRPRQGARRALSRPRHHPTRWRSKAR